jgi:hypothetical protein
MCVAHFNVVHTITRSWKVEHARRWIKAGFMAQTIPPQPIVALGPSASPARSAARFPPPTTRTTFRMSLPATSAACTGAILSAGTFRRTIAFPLLVLRRSSLGDARPHPLHHSDSSKHAKHLAHYLACAVLVSRQCRSGLRRVIRRKLTICCTERLTDPLTMRSRCQTA